MKVKITSSNDTVVTPNYQTQIDEIKKEMSVLNEKLDLILQKI